MSLREIERDESGGGGSGGARMLFECIYTK
jgi:hypothetical protein